MSNVVTKKSIMSKLVNTQTRPSDLATIASLDRYLILNPDDKIKRLQCCLDSDGYAIVSSQGTLNFYLKCLVFFKCFFLNRNQYFGR